MSDEKTRKHGHWKIWGHSLTCSVCDHCCEGGNYCEMCGSIMDEPSEWWCPPLKLPHIVVHPCPSCNEMIFGDKNYCSNCGCELKEMNDEEERTTKLP